MANKTDAPVVINRYDGLMSVMLNRPRVLNTLNIEMIRLLRQTLDEALATDEVRLVVIGGAGDRAFCAGGDLKELTRAVREGAVARADQFFREEYALDLLIYQFPKAVVVLAHGITMGGGLGLAAGADMIVAAEDTRMAMPETRIGFFPDVGATGWLFQKCPPGYPEYLALTGYELVGRECVRVGLASHLAPAALWPELLEVLHKSARALPAHKPDAVKELRLALAPLVVNNIKQNPEMDRWVKEHFAGQTSLPEIIAGLGQASGKLKFGEDVSRRLAERSPTALAVTLGLLRANEGRPLPEVFQREALAAHFMITHPDYLEGIRARIIDKDDKPRWQPASIEALGPLSPGF